jgi:hypothetical protein
MIKQTDKSVIVCDNNQQPIFEIMHPVFGRATMAIKNDLPYKTYTIQQLDEIIQAIMIVKNLQSNMKS